MSEVAPMISAVLILFSVFMAVALQTPVAELVLEVLDKMIAKVYASV